MSYRDDRDALRTEVDTLQKELEGARDDQQRLADLEQRLEATRREMSAMEAELARARGRAPAPRSPHPLVLPLAVVIAATLGGFYLAVAPRSRPPIDDVEPSLAIPPKPPKPPRATAAPSPQRRANVTWTATVTQAQGVPIPVGATCTISAGVVPDDSGMHATDVEVKCGGLSIYDQKAPLSGMSMLDSEATQQASARAGSWVYDLVFRDRGERSPPRNQAQLDSTAMLGKVWSDNLPEISVSLKIQKGSAPVDVAVME